ncbi:uncharacterized protein LODBEIA_P03900 [Lodderomyces beijingensis]|uniref:Protein PBN1 n=1 Tax=Lodderomyces beijingensis TaxID=1775926 RepID=A0ABP0ZH51_9ASCO
MLLRSLGVLALATSSCALQWFPVNSKGEIPLEIEPFEKGQEVQFDCIQRNIDNGEHKFDQQNKIIYGPFPKCKETSKPFSFAYGVNQDINCTIEFSDELYHLFQLYIHEDAPFSCRLPLSSEMLSIEKGGAYIPFTFNFRGEISESHLDIDSSMNVLITKPSNDLAEQYTFISAVAFGSGTNTTRIVIGEELTLNFAIRWFDSLSVKGKTGYDLPYDDGFYKFPMSFIPMSYTVFYSYISLTSVVTALMTLLITYKWVNQKRRYMPLDNESKQD